MWIQHMYIYIYMNIDMYINTKYINIIYRILRKTYNITHQPGYKRSAAQKGSWHQRGQNDQCSSQPSNSSGNIKVVDCFRLKCPSYIVPRHQVIPPEVWCFRYILQVQIPSQQVFRCLGFRILYLIERIYKHKPLTDGLSVVGNRCSHE